MRIAEYRGFVLFDDGDYADYPNPKWRKRALHFNVGRDGVEEISPEHILKLLASPSCQHFVWLSKRIGVGEPVHMIWVYAHELRHVVQDTVYPGLSKMTRSLRTALAGKCALEIPQELDAELAARDLVIALFGGDEYEAYRRRQCANNPRADGYFRRFDELAAGWCGNAISATITSAARYGVDLRTSRERGESDERLTER